MALLTEATRIKYFEKLGLGEYNEANIKKLQKSICVRRTLTGSTALTPTIC